MLTIQATRCNDHQTHKRKMKGEKGTKNDNTMIADTSVHICFFTCLLWLCLYLSFQLAESSMFNAQKYDQYLLCIVSTIEVMYSTITGVMAAGWGAPPWNVPVTRPCSWLLVPRYQDHVAHSRLVTMVTMVTCCQELIKCFRSNNPATSISGVVSQALTAALLHCWHLLIQCNGTAMLL